MLVLLASIAQAEVGVGTLGPSVPPELFPTVAGPAVPVDLLVEPEVVAPVVASAVVDAVDGAEAELLPEAFVLPTETESELLQRFSEAPAASSPEAAGLSLGGGKTWMWALGLGLVGLAWFGREKLLNRAGSVSGDSSPLKVLARQGIGQQAGLVLLEAATGDGGSRRLLVSVSGHGPPSLVADLGGEIPGFEQLVHEDVRAELAANPAPAPAQTVPAVEVAPEPTFQVEFDDEPEDEDTLAAELQRHARLTAHLPPPPSIDMPRAEDAGWRPKRALTGRFTDEDLAPIEDEDPIEQVRAWTSTRDLPAERSDDREGLIDSILEGRVAARVRGWV
jgi:hypothetical protein